MSDSEITITQDRVSVRTGELHTVFAPTMGHAAEQIALLHEVIERFQQSCLLDCGRYHHGATSRRPRKTEDGF